MDAILGTLVGILTGWVPTAALIVICCLCIVFIGKSLYKQAPPNKAMVITSPWGTKTISGKGAFVIPIIQRADYMSLENIKCDFKSRDEIPTKDAINILVDAIANVAISTDPELLKIASSKFLGYSTNDICDIITPVLEGNIREIISQFNLKDIIQGDKKMFAEKVMENVTPNLHDLGLELTTFNIQNFKDNNGIISNLGLENTETIRKDAAIAKAMATKEIAIAQAESDRAANDARIATEQAIAIKDNELAIKKAELKKEADIKKAEADAAYQIQQEEQRKTIEITTANANLARQEKEIELKERAVAIQEKTLDAEVKKVAEAKKYATQQDADAYLYQTQKKSEAELFERAKKAEAEQIEAERRADAMKAEADAKKIQMLAEAEGIKARGDAEAESIRAKALAEADGILKKAEAMKEYGEAATRDMTLEALKVYFEQLPAIAQAVATPLGNVDNITMYGEGNTAKLTGDITKTMKQVIDGVKDSTGIDPMSILSGFLGGKMSNKHFSSEDVLVGYNEDDLK